MEQTFGDHLCKYTHDEEQLAAWQQACETAKAEGVEEPANPCFVDVPIADVPKAQFIAVLFTCEYGPPCVKIWEQLLAFE